MIYRYGFRPFNSRVTPFPDLPFDTSPTMLRYRIAGMTSWSNVDGTAMNVPDTNRVVHTVEISGLEEDTSYEFQLSTNALATYCTWKNDPSTSMVVHWHSGKPFTKRYNSSYTQTIQKFKTAPRTISEKIAIAQVSDTHGGGSVTESVFRRIGLIDNMRCIVHSGDIATGNGGASSPLTWYGFFDALEHARDTGGHIIPLLVTPGNHEVLDGNSGVQYREGVGIKPNFQTKERGDAEWYYCFFPTFPGLTGYGNITFGDYLSVWKLDPGVTTRMDTGQDVWLAQTMQEKQYIPNKVVSLHYPPWPAGRRYMGGYTQAIQNQLLPIWEQHQPIVFSGHDHVFSVSPPIKGGTIETSGINVDEGTYYLGSGTTGEAMQPGRNPYTKWWIDIGIGSEWEYFDYEKAETGGLTTEPRPPHPEDGKSFDWQEGSHFWVMEMDYTQKTMTAYNPYDEIIHSFTVDN